MDGKFLYIDQRVTLVLGFLPQELLGTSMYEYYHPDDIPLLAESHKTALQGPVCVSTIVYRMRNKEGSFVLLQTQWKSFRNPWTKDAEYVIAKNSVILTDLPAVDSSIIRSDGSSHIQENFDFFGQSNGRDMQRMINSHVEASKIGRQIAAQVLDSQRRGDDSSPEGSSPDHSGPSLHTPVTIVEPQISTTAVVDKRQPSMPAERTSGPLPNYSQIRPNETGKDMVDMIGATVLTETPIPPATNDGNDEAAMAVIMSLLEADAGLGGPVDFSGLPWPLP